MKVSTCISLNITPFKLALIMFWTACKWLTLNGENGNTIQFLQSAFYLWSVVCSLDFTLTSLALECLLHMQLISSYFMGIEHFIVFLTESCNNTHTHTRSKPVSYFTVFIFCHGLWNCKSLFMNISGNASLVRKVACLPCLLICI